MRQQLHVFCNMCLAWGAKAEANTRCPNRARRTWMVLVSVANQTPCRGPLSKLYFFRSAFVLLLFSFLFAAKQRTRLLILGTAIYCACC